MDPSMARAESPERYHCNPIMDASGPERRAPRPATGFHSWLFVCRTAQNYPVIALDCSV